MKERPEKLTSSLNLWIGFHGDIPVFDWTGEHAHALRRFFFTLPGKYAQEEKWQKYLKLKDIAAAFQKEITDAATAEEKQTLQATATKATTWNRHRAALSKFWDWARRNNLTSHSTNPFEELFIKVRKGRKPWKGGSEKRVHWPSEAMQKLFASPLFTGCKSPRRRHIPGTLVVRDALYWVVLILAYTGMRREEICQLRVEHLCRNQEDGTWYFDLKAKDLNLKDTAQEDNEDELASKRWVPVPDALIKLGIIGCLHNGRGPKEQLFPELRPRGQDKKFGTKVGRDFERYRKNCDKFCRKKDGENFTPLYVRLMDLHSFRHNFCTELINAGVPQEHAEEISGHKSEARKTAFANYDRGRTLEILKRAIDKLERPIDIPNLIRSAANSKPSA